MDHAAPASAPTSDVAFSPAVKAEQARRGTRPAMERLEAHGGFRTGTERLRAFLAESRSVVLASASADGQPYVQHRGGPPGFLRVLDDDRIGFADLAGNGQYVTAGNLSENPRVQILAIDYMRRRRVKIWGTAEMSADPALLARLSPDDASADRAVVVTVTAWDLNCPQHIPQRFEAGDVAAAVAERESRIAELEAKVARLEADARMSEADARVAAGRSWSTEGCAGAGDD
ncbi:pyridoxamine 5'-phosphate oxidase family protein [Jannaschia sp. Os4]|uniref:pyridoxamine 5'-phosphate oxidase family protein n=1 Tax=Jannaschia sp. Os4 TaxID=2807617 RepID=UPI00193A0335|nr:pyridoxamine 5'-phosphate oxidase family protein [Jannaschia sp. Os4]MBM2576224.1 pyridoxamine 5'-phosphate oxidase family protein [Jannaschia sp. Os4]